jgi:hypothetical protein
MTAQEPVLFHQIYEPDFLRLDFVGRLNLIKSTALRCDSVPGF